jgi:hypothetical protein
LFIDSSLFKHLTCIYFFPYTDTNVRKLLSAHHKIFMAIHAPQQKQDIDDLGRTNTTSISSSLTNISGTSIPIKEEQDIAADLDSIRIQLQPNITTTTSATSPKETQQQQQQATPKLYVREDGTVDWEGALQDQAALKLFGTAVWARINGQDPTEVSEGRIVQQNHPHPENEKKKNVTANIQETVAIREERDRLHSLQRLLQTVEERHTALLSSGIQTGAVTANVNLALIPADLRTKIRESTRELEKVRERVAFQKLVYDLERIYVYLDGEIGTTRAGGSVPLQDRLAVAEFGLFESQVEALRSQLMDSGEATTSTTTTVDMEDDDENWRIDSDVLLVLVDQLNDFKGRLGIDYYVTGLTLDSDAIKRWLMDLWMQTKKGLAFYVKGCQLLANDLVYCGSLIGRAITQGYTLKPREVRTLRRTFKDVLTFIPFVIILIIPLSPIGHVLVFGAIQRFFPDFFPSCFTERRQNLLQLYERTEYTEVVMDEPWQKKLVRLGEATAYVIAEGLRRLWKLISEGDKSSTDGTQSNTKDE